MRLSAEGMSTRCSIVGMLLAQTKSIGVNKRNREARRPTATRVCEKPNAAATNRHKYLNIMLSLCINMRYVTLLDQDCLLDQVESTFDHFWVLVLRKGQNSHPSVCWSIYVMVTLRNLLHRLQWAALWSIIYIATDSLSRQCLFVVLPVDFTGAVICSLTLEPRQTIYRPDITYSQNAECCGSFL